MRSDDLYSHRRTTKKKHSLVTHLISPDTGDPLKGDSSGLSSQAPRPRGNLPHACPTDSSPQLPGKGSRHWAHLPRQKRLRCPHPQRTTSPTSSVENPRHGSQQRNRRVTGMGSSFLMPPSRLETSQATLAFQLQGHQSSATAKPSWHREITESSAASEWTTLQRCNFGALASSRMATHCVSREGLCGKNKGRAQSLPKATNSLLMMPITMTRRAFARECMGNWKICWRQQCPRSSRLRAQDP